MNAFVVPLFALWSIFKLIMRRSVIISILISVSAVMFCRAQASENTEGTVYSSSEDPDFEKAKKCHEDLTKNRSFVCVMAAMEPKIEDWSEPRHEKIKSCGCAYGGLGSSTKLGKRRTYVCQGPPYFYVIYDPNVGDIGVAVMDNPTYPDCFFDVLNQRDGLKPLFRPSDGNRCFSCHDRETPFLGGGTYLPAPDQIREFLHARVRPFALSRAARATKNEAER